MSAVHVFTMRALTGHAAETTPLLGRWVIANYGPDERSLIAVRSAGSGSQQRLWFGGRREGAQ